MLLAFLPATQCEAVSTQLDLISVPPQKCEPKRLFSDAMNVYFPSGTAVPPTIFDCADAEGTAAPMVSAGTARATLAQASRRLDFADKYFPSPRMTDRPGCVPPLPGRLRGRVDNLPVCCVSPSRTC